MVAFGWGMDRCFQRLCTLRVACLLAAAVAWQGTPGWAVDTVSLEDQLHRLQEQNQTLQEQLRQQQGLIEALTRKVNGMESAARETAGSDSGSAAGANAAASSTASTWDAGKVRLSGEGGVGFYKSGSEGLWPNSEFRVDEARLFLEAPITEPVYFYGEINLFTPESTDLTLHVGEMYVDVEDVSRLWGRDHQLNVRLGRMYIPFGEQYLYRHAIDNPLISRSVTDIWGTDEGVELYGRLGPVSYVVAVQNGGPSGVRDYTSDKSVTGRLSVEPAPWLQLSASAMRTGDLDARQDFVSELWFGGGWFRSIGSAQTTTFHAELFEGDVTVRLPHGHLKAFGGYAHYADNDPLGDNQRDLYYYSVEAVQDLTRKLYLAARFSEVLAPGGYPLPGNGNLNEYFLSPGELATELWRLSLGVGYRFSPNLVFKGEYSFERGKQTNGESRNHEDLFALQAAFKF